MDQKQAEQKLFNHSPAAQRLLKEGKKLTRNEKRKAYWAEHGPKRTQSRLP